MKWQNQAATNAEPASVKRKQQNGLTTARRNSAKNPRPQRKRAGKIGVNDG